MIRVGILAVALALVCVQVVLAPGPTTTWLADDGRVFRPVMVPMVLITFVLILYFDWRGRMLRRFWPEHDVYKACDSAA